MIKEKAGGSAFVGIVILRKDSMTPLLGDKTKCVPEMGHESLLSRLRCCRRSHSPL